MRHTVSQETALHTLVVPAAQLAQKLLSQIRPLSTTDMDVMGDSTPGPLNLHSRHFLGGRQVTDGSCSVCQKACSKGGSSPFLTDSHVGNRMRQKDGLEDSGAAEGIYGAAPIMKGRIAPGVDSCMHRWLRHTGGGLV